MKYKAVLFDVDGLVIASPRFSDRLQKEHGITWETMKPFFQGPFQECKLGKSDLKAELAKVVQDWGWQGSVEELLSFWFKDDVVNQEVVALVKNLQAQNVPCYLATNQEPCRNRYLRDQVGLGEVFDGIFTSSEIGHLKNEPQFFEEVIVGLNGLPGGSGTPMVREQILFIDHDAENIDAARKAGIETHVFHGLADLQAFLKQVD